MQPGAHGIQQKDKAPSFHTGKGLEYTLPNEDTDGQENTHEAQRHSPSGNANQTREVSPPPGRPLQAAHDRRQSQEAAGVGTRRRRPSSPLLGEEGGPAAAPTAWQLPASWVHRRRTTGTQADGLGPGRAARAPGTRLCHMLLSHSVLCPWGGARGDAWPTDLLPGWRGGSYVSG